MELNLEKEGISNEEELIFWLRDHVDEYNFTRQDINDLIINNMQSEYLSKYRDELVMLSENDALSKALMETDLSEVNSLQDLYQHLISEADKYGYTPEDVNKLFANLAENEELNELHSNLTELASGDLKKVLLELDPQSEGIQSPVDLITYLMDESLNQDYTNEDVIELLLNYLEKEDLREIIKLLIGTSSGELMNLLLNLDLEQNNIRSLDDLYNYLIEQSQYYEFTEDDVIRLFLNLLKILEYEPIIQELETTSDLDIKDKPGKGWIFFVLGGIGLIILIILFTRRKESTKKDESV